MIGILFAGLCWAIWQLSPHNISALAFEKDAILHGEWWRLWSTHFTHFSYARMQINSGILAIGGIITARFVPNWQILLCFAIALPTISGLLLLTTPHLLFYRGAAGIAAMMWMLATWFLIVESRRFSLGYWLGLTFLLLFAAKAGLEGLALLSPHPHHGSGSHIAWLVQIYGALIGLACFNGLHQLHLTRSGNNPQYRGPYRNKPSPLNQARRS
jgi:hypothetical protein